MSKKGATKREKTKDVAGWIAGGLVFSFMAFLFCVYLSVNPYFRVAAILLGALIIGILYLFYREGEKDDDRVRGRFKRTSTMLITGVLLPVLYFLVAINFFRLAFEHNSLTELWFWLGIEAGCFILLTTWVHIRARLDHYMTLHRLEAYEEALESLGYELDSLGQLQKRKDEDG
jgi:amino acid transporter